MARAFGTGNEQIVIQFIRYEPSPSFDFHLVGKPLGPLPPRPVLRLKFGTTGEAVRTSALPGTAGELPALFLAGRLDNLDIAALDPDEFEQMNPADQRRRLAIPPLVESAVTTATIRLPTRMITLNLGSMGPPMAALRKCTEGLVKEWGLDPAQQEALPTRPMPKSSPGRWLHSSDYPRESLATGQQAIVRFRLMVNAAGTVTNCSVQSAIAKGNFAALTCDLLKRRARFDPARDATGTTVGSYYVGKVRWIMG